MLLEKCYQIHIFKLCFLLMYNLCIMKGKNIKLTLQLHEF